MSVPPVPAGFHTVTPYLLLEDVAGFLEFAERAFDAVELERIGLPDGTVMHAQIRIGDSPVMMGTAKGEWPPMPAFLHLYVPDADAVHARAVAAGATSVQEPKDELYGDRTSGVRDGFGNLWCFATRLENLSAEEILERMAAPAPEEDAG